jgi:glycosyltransferase involved in cell wall biosynthesis
VTRVLTSTHGVGVEQRDAEIERRLLLQDAFDHPPVTAFSELRRLETHNHDALRETVAAFRPDLVHVWSLQGLSKSLIYTLQRLALPTVYAVMDDWLAAGIRADPWLRWWNRPAAPFLSELWRALLELSGRRNPIDLHTPTRMMPGYERLPEVYGTPAQLAAVRPNSIAAFRLARLHFCSYLLKGQAERAGFQVQHAAVIYPGVRVEPFIAPPRPQSAPTRKFLIVSELVPESGVMTALEAWRLLPATRANATLSIYGSGRSDYVAKLRSFVVTQQLPVEFLTLTSTTRDLVAVYRQHDALLHPAEWNEPFAQVVCEAIASGLPVICSRAGGIHEVLRHGETAFTYAAGDARELANRVQELQIQPALRCQVVENAQQLLFTTLSESAVTDQIEQYLEESLPTGVSPGY